MIENSRELKFLIWLAQNPQKHLPKKYYQLEWERVIKYAEKNRIIPFFYHFINCQSCRKKLPKKWQKLLEKRLMGATYVHQVQEKEKDKINHEFSKKKIIIVPLKDISVYKINYPPNLFSQKTDLDFFISEIRQKELIGKIMKSLGYQFRQLAVPKKYLSKFDERSLNYIKKTGATKIMIDFHIGEILPESKRKVNPITKEVNEKFTQAFIKSIHLHKKSHFHLASPEVHFLFWCWHFFLRDNCQKLRTLFDLAQICKQPNINWNKTLAIAQELRLSAYFLFVVALTRQIFKVRLPLKVSRAISKTPSVSLALKLYSPLLTAQAESAEELLNEKLNKESRRYFFLIKLLLWEKPTIFKLGPRVLFYSFYYLPLVYLKSRLN